MKRGSLFVGFIFIFLLISMVSFVPAPGTEGVEEEKEGNIIKIKLEAEDHNKIVWEAEGYSSKGFKVVWSKNENPVYPTRKGDKYHYYSDSGKSDDKLDAFDGEGNYYVRVCEYLGGKCEVYSNQIELFLSESRDDEKEYKHAHWKCFDDREEEIEGEEVCKSLDSWKTIAHTDCKERCNEDGDKCGVFSFSVSEKCGVGNDEKEDDEDDEDDEKEDEDKEDEDREEKHGKGEISIICNGCSFNETGCYPLGYRKAGNYCSDSLEFVGQMYGDNSSCENNFECKSNVCISGECVGQGLIKKILDWLKGFFGKD